MRAVPREDRAIRHIDQAHAAARQQLPGGARRPRGVVVEGRFLAVTTGARHCAVHGEALVVEQIPAEGDFGRRHGIVRRYARHREATRKVPGVRCGRACRQRHAQNCESGCQPALHSGAAGAPRSFKVRFNRGSRVHCTPREPMRMRTTLDKCPWTEQSRSVSPSPRRSGGMRIVT